MLGVILLKSLYNLSDEGVVPEAEISFSLDKQSVTHGEGAVAERGQFRIVRDDYDCLAMTVAEVEEELVDFRLGG